jgi:hypothetical protein
MNTQVCHRELARLRRGLVERGVSIQLNSSWVIRKPAQGLAKGRFAPANELTNLSLRVRFAGRGIPAGISAGSPRRFAPRDDRQGEFTSSIIRGDVLGCRLAMTKGRRLLSPDKRCTWFAVSP